MYAAKFVFAGPESPPEPRSTTVAYAAPGQFFDQERSAITVSKMGNKHW
jgi:hypothetical protein